MFDKERTMQDLDLELRLAPSTCEGSSRRFVTSFGVIDGDDIGDPETYDVPPLSKKICLFPCSSMSVPLTAKENLDLALRLAVGDPIESCSGADSCLEDVVEFILSYLDKESLVWLKLVTKRCNEIVSARAHLPVNVTFSGIVFQGYNLELRVPKSPLFLQLDCSGGATLCPFEIGCNWFVLDSCNGLLLVVIRGGYGLCLCDPISKAIAIVPDFPKSLIRESLAMAHTLAFDGQRYHEVSVLMLKTDEVILGLISSDGTVTWHWKVVTVKVPAEVTGPNFTVNISSLFFKGNLLFLLFDWLVIYRVKDDHSEFLKLPHGRKISRYPRCMWQSEGGLYYGCGSCNQGFEIWELVSVGERSDWQIKESYLLETLAREYPESFSDALNTLDYPMGPGTFNDDFQILYLHLPRTIVAYHLKTRTFRTAFTFPRCQEPVMELKLMSYNFRPKPCNFPKEAYRVLT